MNIITRTSDIMLLGKHIFKESEICPWTFMQCFFLLWTGICLQGCQLQISRIISFYSWLFVIDGKLTLVSVELRNVLQWWKDTVGILSSGTANIAKVKNYPIWSVQIVPKILPKLVFLSSKIGGFSMSKHFQGFSGGIRFRTNRLKIDFKFTIEFTLLSIAWLY